MNATFLNKAASVYLSLLVLMSSMSLTVEKHFCGGKLVDVALFSEVSSCCGSKIDLTKAEDEEDSCCNNEVEVVKGIDNITIKAFDDFEPVVQIFFTAFSLSYAKLFEENHHNIPHKRYRPPKLIQDIHVLNETYLI